MEEQVGVIFNSTASGAVFVNVVGIPGSSFCSGKSTADKPPGKGFDYRWEIPGLPSAPKDVVGLVKDAPRALLRKLDGVLSGEVPVNFFCGADAVPGGLPPKNILLVSRHRTNRGDGLDCLIVKSVSQKLQIPSLSVRDPKVRGSGWKWRSGDW